MSDHLTDADLRAAVDRLRSELNGWQVKYQNLLASVKVHHDQRADDRCVEDDAALYAAAGLGPHDPRVGDKFEMLKNCARFIDQRCRGGGWPTYRELEVERDRLRAENERLRDALAPFADYAGTLDAAGVPDAAPVQYAPDVRGRGPTAGDCRRAAAATGSVREPSPAPGE